MVNRRILPAVVLAKPSSNVGLGFVGRIAGTAGVGDVGVGCGTGSGGGICGLRRRRSASSPSGVSSPGSTFFRYLLRRWFFIIGFLQINYIAFVHTFARGV